MSFLRRSSGNRRACRQAALGVVSWRLTAALALLVLSGVLWYAARRHVVTAHATFIRHQAPEFLTFEELKTLAVHPVPTGDALRKYEALWTTPIISNEAYEAGARPRLLQSPQLGPYVRVATWNIEKSLHMDRAITAFTDADGFARLLDPIKALRGSPAFDEAMAERALLAEADIILLQEMDLGVKRSGYLDAARALAQALGMNYAYLPEYLEIDPVMLGTEMIQFVDGQKDAEATTYYAADPAHYRGLFGCAVLSRYPILRVEGRRLQTQGYDWYAQERFKTTFLENLRRVGAQTVFLETQHREMKVGGRTYFRVDLQVPELPEQRISVINVHLEIKCTPKVRAAQIAEILGYIKDIRHPVILAGDFNSAPQDLSPTSMPRVLGRHLSKPETWLSGVINATVPQSLVINAARFMSNVTKNYQTPTAPHIPLIAPNRVRELFATIELFRFADGGAFDFRGDTARSAGKAGPLSNANERDRWGYATTFRVERTVASLIGKYRLDWMFIRAYTKNPRPRQGAYRFAPHFGRTLNTINELLVVPISDHDPNTVDLPLQEPPPLRRRP